jgi:hypothetical protein
LVWIERRTRGDEGAADFAVSQVKAAEEEAVSQRQKRTKAEEKMEDLQGRLEEEQKERATAEGKMEEENVRLKAETARVKEEAERKVTTSATPNGKRLGLGSSRLRRTLLCCLAGQGRGGAGDP